MGAIINEWLMLFKGFHKGLRHYVKYQIAMLLIFSVVLMPLFGVATNTLLQYKKVPAVSNHMLLEYIFSFNGLIFAILLIFILLLGIVLEIGGLTFISLQQLGHYSDKSTRSILLTCFKKIPAMLEAGSLFIILYFVVLTPFIGIGPTLSFIDGLKLPEFIESVIEDLFFIQVLLTIFSVILSILILRGIFVFHFILFKNSKPNQALRESAQLVSAHKWLVIKEVFILAALTAGFIFMVSWGWDGFIQSLIGFLNPSSTFTKALMVALLILQDMGILIFGMLFIPFEIYHFTHVYLHIDSHSAHNVKNTGFDTMLEKMSPPNPSSLIDRLLANKPVLMVITIAVLFIAAIPGGIFFDEWFRADQDIAVMAHRGGGFLADENSLEGITAAIKAEADWSELDIQRDALGKYVLNHDPLEEGEVYPLLEDALHLAKGKIKLNLELKGNTVDTQMVDDVLSMIHEMHMTYDVMLSTVDYKIVEYIEKKDPEIATGIIYVFALGDVSQYHADVIIMEAQQLSEDLVADIHDAKKKIIVWTSNDPDTLWSLVRQDVDGIITDDIKLLLQTIEERDQESDEELLYSIFFD